MNDIRDFRGVCALFMEYIPPRLVRLNLLGLTIVLVWHIHYGHIILLHFICCISFGVNPNQILFNQIIFQIRLVFSKFSIKLVSQFWCETLCNFFKLKQFCHNLFF